MFLLNAIKNYTNSETFINSLKDIVVTSNDLSESINYLRKNYKKITKKSLQYIINYILTHCSTHFKDKDNDITYLLGTISTNFVFDDTSLLVLFNLDLNEYQYEILCDIFMNYHYYTLWKTSKTFDIWTINFFIDTDPDLILDDLESFLNKINDIKYKLTNTSILSLVTKSNVNEKHLLLFDKYGYSWYNENNLIKYIKNYSYDRKEVNEQFMNVLNMYNAKNILNLDVIIKLINNKYIHKIIQSSLFASNKYTITKEKFYEFFEYYRPNMETIIINLFDKCIYTSSVEDLEYLSSLDTINESLFSYFKIKHNILLTETMFINSIKNNNISLIKYFLDNKLIPKEEYIYKYIKFSKSNENKLSCDIINLLINYGLVITPQLYVYIKLLDENKNIIINSTLIGIPLSLEQTTDNIIKHNKIKKIKKIKNIKNITDLQRMYKSCTLSEIQDITNKSKKKIDPDITCFKMSLYNPNIEVMLYVFETYNFIPKILDIIKISDLKLRYYILYKFYPQMASEY
jgi:hypothetical protein